MTGPSVLVVDDEPDELALLTRHLRRLGCDVVGVPTAERALDDEANLESAVAFVDLRLPGMGGADLIDLLHRLRPAMGIVVTSVLDTDDYPLGDVWLPKPFTGDGVRQALTAALAVRQDR
jgi:CheY-like chemotaxis protein